MVLGDVVEGETRKFRRGDSLETCDWQLQPSHELCARSGSLSPGNYSPTLYRTPLYDTLATRFCFSCSRRGATSSHVPSSHPSPKPHACSSSANPSTLRCAALYKIKRCSIDSWCSPGSTGALRSANENELMKPSIPQNSSSALYFVLP